MLKLCRILSSALFLFAIGSAYLPSLWGYEFSERFVRMQNVVPLPVITTGTDLISVNNWRAARDYINRPAPAIKPFVIRLYHMTVRSIAHKLPDWSPGFLVANHVLVPPGDWLFYTFDFTNCYTQTDLDELTGAMKDIAQLLANAGKDFHIVIIPDKGWTYRDRLGFYQPLPRCAERSRTHIIDALKHNLPSSASITDFSPALTRMTAAEQTFFKTDTHWNDRTRMIISQQIVNNLQRLVFPNSDIVPAGSVMRETDLANNSMNLDLKEGDILYRTIFHPVATEKIQIDPAGWPTIRYHNEYAQGQAFVPGHTLVITDSFFYASHTDVGKYFQDTTWLHVGKFNKDYVPDLLREADRILYVPVGRNFLKVGARIFLQPDMRPQWDKAFK